MNRKTKYDNKFIRKTIRFTDDEFKIIEEQRAKTNLDFTNFCKSAILRKRVKTKVQEDFNSNMIYQINKIGNNLNQIARKVRSNERLSVLMELKQIEEHLKDLKNDN